jgi:pimeloyl-ACP methyl ester carboxylesterase
MTSSHRTQPRRGTVGAVDRRFDDRRVTTIVVTGTGVCYATAFAYYAPLRGLVPGSKLHILEWWGLASVQRSVDRLVRRLHQADSPVNLIGHSQGGLVAALASEMVPDLVDRVITICAPLSGTEIAPAWSPVLPVGEMTRIRPIPQRWQAAPTMVNVVASADCFIVPHASGLREGAEHHVLSGAEHFGAIWDPRLHRLVREVMGRPTRFSHPAAASPAS